MTKIKFHNSKHYLHKQLNTNTRRIEFSDYLIILDLSIYMLFGINHTQIFWTPLVTNNHNNLRFVPDLTKGLLLPFNGNISLNLPCER